MRTKAMWTYGIIILIQIIHCGIKQPYIEQTIITYHMRFKKKTVKSGEMPLSVPN